MTKRIHLERLNQYIAAVQSGERPACKWERLAVARHIADIERSKSDDYPYYFDEREANKRCKRAELWEHTKGRWAKRREHFRMEPWQCFIIGSLFGWKKKSNDLRRFAEAYVEIPRKNGKSPTAAIIGIEMFAFDGEAGAEVYTGATSEAQAWEVFRPAKLMMEKAEDVCAEAGIEVWAKAIIKPSDQSRFTTIIGKPGDGAAPHCAIVDEFHEHVTADLVDTMATGMVGREQPLMLYITTAGDNTAGPCYAKREEVCQVLQGTTQDDRIFGLIYTIDEDDDWSDPKILAKANPNLGVSVDLDQLLAWQRNAVRNPIAQARFQTKHLNVWVRALHGLINVHRWRSLADQGLSAEELQGEPCWFSVDLASKSDLCAFVKLFRKELDGKPHYYGFLKCYLPEMAFDDSKENRAIYIRARREGSLIVTPGATVDFEQILEDVKTEGALYNPEEFIFDPWNAAHFAQKVAGEGITVVEYPQTLNNMAVPTDDLSSIINDGRFHHSGCQLFEWQASNALGKSGRKGLTVPVKDKPHKKIDGFIGLVMAMGRASAEEEQGTDSGLVLA